MNKKENLYDRLLCFLCILSITSAFVLCAISPFHASADDVIPYGDIANAVKAYEQRAKGDMDALQEAVQNDIDNGNLDASSALGREYLNAIAFQYLALNNPSMISLYNAVDYADTEAQQWIDWFNSHQTLNISGSGASGFYKSYKDQKIHIVNYVPPSTFSRTPVFSIPVFTSDEFTVTFTATSPTWNWTISPYYDANYARYGIHIVVPMYQGQYANPKYTFSESSGYFYTYTVNSSNISYNESKFLNIGGNSIPTLSANLLTNNMPYNANSYIGGLGSYQTLPPETIDTSEPWSYYNNTVLPYIHQNFPNTPDTYLIFPQGYTPAQDPTEPPLPNGNDGGISVTNNWNFNIGINNITVTDASGQPVTDASGETVTETVIETETRPTDAVYHFQIPTLTPLETQVATIPPYDVPVEYAGYMGNVFTAITDFIDDAGLSDVAPVFLALAGIGLVIGVLL